MLFMNYALSFNPQDGKEVFDKACSTQKLIKCRDPDSSIYSIFHTSEKNYVFFHLSDQIFKFKIASSV